MSIWRNSTRRAILGKLKLNSQCIWRNISAMFMKMWILWGLIWRILVKFQIHSSIATMVIGPDGNVHCANQLLTAINCKNHIWKSIRRIFGKSSQMCCLLLQTVCKSHFIAKEHLWFFSTFMNSSTFVISLSFMNSFPDWTKVLSPIITFSSSCRN